MSFDFLHRGYQQKITNNKEMSVMKNAFLSFINGGMFLFCLMMICTTAFMWNVGEISGIYAMCIEAVSCIATIYTGMASCCYEHFTRKNKKNK